MPFRLPSSPRGAFKTDCGPGGDHWHSTDPVLLGKEVAFQLFPVRRETGGVVPGCGRKLVPATRPVISHSRPQFFRRPPQGRRTASRPADVHRHRSSAAFQKLAVIGSRRLALGTVQGQHSVPDVCEIVLDSPGVFLCVKGLLGDNPNRALVRQKSQLHGPHHLPHRNAPFRLVPQKPSKIIPWEQPRSHLGGCQP